ncbi:SAM-dependent methyltransferase [bacterium]|jgi:SAM-dependent methyltransferase|nr:SAM-dependent methyltransferase [bacterium]HCK12451.1 SAM-dependent methyltransferase [Candidatus Latescibacterota bacterium]
MKCEDLRYLRSVEGRGLLEAIDTMLGDSLMKQTRLRRDYPADRVRAAVALAELRERAEGKFEHAQEMFFDRDGLEQASGDVIARHRAERYRGLGRVGDLCCGIGGDSAALAAVADVTAVDILPIRVQMAKANLSFRGLSAEFVNANVGQLSPNFDGLFFDPSRREGNRRAVHISDYVPSLSELAWWSPSLPMGIKVSPGISHSEIPKDCEAEFISVGGDCKEIVLWFGDLRSKAKVRATLLPAGDTLEAADTGPVRCGDVSAFLYEPDRAIVRAHLIEQVAAEIGAHKLDPKVAYLTGDESVDTPYATTYRVVDVMKFSIKRLQDYVKSNEIGQIEIKKRRFPMTPEAVLGKLELSGSESATVVLTRVSGNPTAIFCRRLSAC